MSIAVYSDANVSKSDCSVCSPH